MTTTKIELTEFNLSIPDYIVDTQHLNCTHHGAYLLLMMQMRKSGGWIDDDDQKLAAVCRTTVDKWRKIAGVIRPLLLSKDGKLSQKRVLADVENDLRRISKNRSSGGAGGKAKALKYKDRHLAPGDASLSDRYKSEQEAPPIGLFTDSEIGEDSCGVGGVGGNPSPELVRRHRRVARSMIPDDWQPSATGIAYAQQCGFVDPKLATMRNGFVNYHRSRGKLIADSEAAWRNWCDNEVKFNRDRGGPPFGPAPSGGPPNGSGPRGRVSFGDIASGRNR